MAIAFVSEKDFGWIKAALRANAVADKTSKGPAALGILQDLAWKQNLTIAAFDGSLCAGLMVIDYYDKRTGVEIEQWVTRCGGRGIGAQMLAWLRSLRGIKQLKLYPLGGALNAYHRLGFTDAQDGGYLGYEEPPS